MQQIQPNNFSVLTHDEIIDRGEVRNILDQLLRGSELQIQESMCFSSDISIHPYFIVKHNDFEWVIRISKEVK